MAQFGRSFHALMTEHEIAAADTFGEMLLLIPMKKVVNRDPVRDTSRAVYHMQAQFLLPDITVWPGGGSGSDVRKDLPLPVSSRNPHAILPKCRLQWGIRQGDQIHRCNGDMYEVTDVKPHDMIEVLVELVQLGIQSQFN